MIDPTAIEPLVQNDGTSKLDDEQKAAEITAVQEDDQSRSKMVDPTAIEPVVQNDGASNTDDASQAPESTPLQQDEQNQPRMVDPTAIEPIIQNDGSSNMDAGQQIPESTTVQQADQSRQEFIDPTAIEPVVQNDGVPNTGDAQPVPENTAIQQAEALEEKPVKKSSGRFKAKKKKKADPPTMDIGPPTAADLLAMAMSGTEALPIKTPVSDIKLKDKAEEIEPLMASGTFTSKRPPSSVPNEILLNLDSDMVLESMVDEKPKFSLAKETGTLRRAKKLRRQKANLLEVNDDRPPATSSSRRSSLGAKSTIVQPSSARPRRLSNAAKAQPPTVNAPLCSRMIYGLRLGLSSVDTVLLRTLALHTYDERVMVQEEFYRTYGQDLEIWITDLIHPEYHPLIKMLLTDRSRLIAMRLHESLHDIYNRLDQIVEDLVLHSCVDLLEVKKYYLQLYGENLEDHIENCCKSEPHVKQFLTALCRASADQASSASAEGDMLQEMLQSDWSNEKGKFSNLLNACYKKLQATMASGPASSKEKPPPEDVDDDGFFVEAVEHFLSCVISPHAWFSKKLYQHMAVDDEVLLEILITRKNIDLIKINNDYDTRYGTSLTEAVLTCYDGKMTRYLMDTYLRWYLDQDELKAAKAQFDQYCNDAEKLRKEIEGVPEPSPLPEPSPVPDTTSTTSLVSEPLPPVQKQPIRKKKAPSPFHVIKNQHAHPTVIGYEKFEPENLVAELHKAFASESVDEGHHIIVSILCRATYRQRVLIHEIYGAIYNEDLYGKIEDYLPTREAQLVLQLFLHPASIDAFYLKQELNNFSLDEQCLILFLGHRYGPEMELMTESYETIFKKHLEHDVRLRLEDKKQIQDLFMQLIHGERKQMKGKPDENLVKSYASRLYPDSKKPHAIPVPLLLEVLSKYSRNEILAIFREFASISGRDVVSCVQLTTSGDFRKCVLSIINYVRDPIEFAARELYGALIDAGGNKDLICYVILSRAEHDLATIMQYFHMVYRRQLLDVMKTHLPADVYGLLRHLCTTHHSS